MKVQFRSCQDMVRDEGMLARLCETHSRNLGVIFQPLVITVRLTVDGVALGADPFARGRGRRRRKGGCADRDRSGVVVMVMELRRMGKWVLY